MAQYAFLETTLWHRFRGHLRTVMIHKYHVAEGCFRIGLYKQGIMHDLSKFSPTEFLTSVKYYDGHRSPNAVERELYGCSRAWLHHKGRNRHHFEYWIDFSAFAPDIAIGCRMPMKYVAEMVCDRIAASKNYKGKDYTDASAWEYYAHSRDHYILHPETRAQLETCLQILRDEGEDACFAYIRTKLLGKRK